MQIQIKHRGKIVARYSSLSLGLSTFKGGEENVRLDAPILPCLKGEGVQVNVIIKKYTSRDIMQAFLITDALRQVNKKVEVSLVMLYVPYARQDRKCHSGEAFSLKVFASLVNAQKYANVYMADPHSHMTPALIDNSVVISQLDLLKHIIRDRPFLCEHTLLCPDAGAVSKVTSLASELHLPVIYANKLRAADGNVVVTIPDTIEGVNTILIVDDICDGGRTFMALAKAVREKNRTCRIGLFVTHGIFSYGVEELFAVIDELHTTNSYEREDFEGRKLIETYDILDLIK